MEKKYLIYKHTNKINGKVYIGQTYQDPEKRQQNGISAYKHNEHFLSAINKYGQDNFDHEVIVDNLSEEEMKYYEDYYIEYYDARNPEKGYNILKGGLKSPFQTLQEDSNFRQKMSEQQSRLMKERIENNPNEKLRLKEISIKNQENHPERKKEYSERMTTQLNEQQQNEEYRKKQSENMKKLQQDEKYKEKMVMNSKNNAINNQNNPEYRKKMCKGVINIETGQYFESGVAAGRQCGVDRSTITKALKNGRTAGKHPETKEPLHWRYATEGSDL